DLMSISPKLHNSTPTDRDGGRWAEQHERLRYQPEVLRQLISEYPYQLKFVVQGESDLAEIQRIVQDVGATSDRVLLMPEGTNPITLQQRAVTIAELCKRFQYRYGPRLHID